MSVAGTDNSSVAGQETFGAADQVFPRATDSFFRTVTVNIDGMVFDPNPGVDGDVMTTTYASTVPGSVFGVNVVDPAPREISNLIADQTADNPAAPAWPHAIASTRPALNTLRTVFTP